MSFIHYKLITNQNYEKIAFDGVSLSVGELKKLILEKKFRKYTSASSSSSSSAPTISRKSDIDLEVTNVDTNEVYQKDTDLIPKNSRVQINRVVKNIGPAIAGGTIRLTHKESEQMENLKLKQQQQQLKQESETSQDKQLDLNVLIQPLSPKATQPSPSANLYADLLNEEDSLYSSPFINDQPANEPSQLPPEEILCPFEENNERHLMSNAVIVPCCGYFICCESCIKTKLDHQVYVECPREDCQQEITLHHRLTPYKPIRQKVNDFLSKNPNTPSYFSKELFETQSDKHKAQLKQAASLHEVHSEPFMKMDQESIPGNREIIPCEPVKVEKEVVKNVSNVIPSVLKRSRSLSPISTNSEKSSLSKVTSASSSKASNQSINSVSSVSKSSLSLSDVTEAEESTNQNSESSGSKRSRSLSPSVFKQKEEDQREKGEEKETKEVDEKKAVQQVEQMQKQMLYQTQPPSFQPQTQHAFVPQMPLHTQPITQTYHHQPPHTFQINRQYGRGMATPYGQQYPSQQVYPGYTNMPPNLNQPPPYMYGAPHDMSYLRQHPMNIPPSMPYSHYVPTTTAQFGWNANIPQAMHPHHQMPAYYHPTSAMTKPQISRESKHVRRSSRSRSRSRIRRGDGRGAGGGERKRRSSRSRSGSSSRSSRDKRRRYKSRSRSSSRHARHSKRPSHRNRRSRTRSRSVSRTRHYKSTRREVETASTKPTSTSDRRERSREQTRRDRSSDSSHKKRESKKETTQLESNKDIKPSDKNVKSSSRDFDDSFESVSTASSASSSSKSSKSLSLSLTTASPDTSLKKAKETTSVKQVEEEKKINESKDILAKAVNEESRKNEAKPIIIKLNKSDLNNNALKSPTKSNQYRIDSISSPVKCLSPSSTSNSSTSSPVKKPKRLVHLKKDLATVGARLSTSTVTTQSTMVHNNNKEMKTNGETHKNVVQQTLSINSHEEDVLDISINEKDHSL